MNNSPGRFFSFIMSKRSLRWSTAVFIGLMCTPIPKDPFGTSKALYSSDGKLLSATVSPQQQWRLSTYDNIPQGLKDAIILYEDEYFYFHLGINPISICKAIGQNIKARRIVRGASTIPMQVIRMRRPNSSRSIFNKIYEAIASIKYSITRSKTTVIHDWISIAPFGGNTIGAQAASLRYFGQDISNLSWSEYALLAVMPNSPSTANLTSGRQELKKKRDHLLDKLSKSGHFSSDDLIVYKDELLPTMIQKIPNHGYHLLQFLGAKYPEKSIFRSTIPYATQLQVEEMLAIESTFYQIDDIRNMAAIVIDIKSNKLLSYVGNTPTKSNRFSYVDVAQAPRSYGSLLKPLLYTYGIQEGFLIPGQLVEDIPTAIGDYQPVNFDEKYRGMVQIEDMITQSLNVPAVRTLQRVGLDGFYQVIKDLRLSYLDRGAQHYGLSLILGGGECTLWDLARLYKGLAQNYSGELDSYGDVTILNDTKSSKKSNRVAMDPSALANMVDAMASIHRPREERSWESFGTSHKIAWKTGTSFGHRDAWSIGFNGHYAVAVWVGNENGEGRHDLTGILKAAPVMFKIFNSLPDNHWLPPPILSNRKQKITVCNQSGRLASKLCRSKRNLLVSKSSMRYDMCSFHQDIDINQDGFQIPPGCNQKIYRRDTMFSLPPTVEYYYAPSHLEYKSIPQIDPSCADGMRQLTIIYPTKDVKIFVPKTPQQQNKLIAQAYMAGFKSTCHWYLNGTYIQSTTNERNHSIEINIGAGSHTLLVVGDRGERHEVSFDILSKK